MVLNFENKVVVITGAVGGLGSAMARRFATDGAKLAVCDRRNTEAIAKELTGIGAVVRGYDFDITDRNAVADAMAQIAKDFGNISVLVNNAGITRDNLLPSLGTADIDDVIDINLKGTIFMTQALIRTFVKKRSGVIINLSSVVGMMGNKGQTNYAASKAGVIGFTKAVAKEYGRRNIRCNAIAPGYIATDMTAQLSEEMTAELTKQLPIGRLGQPEDVANLALFLAGDCAGYITGEVIKVDGGMYI